MRPTCRPGSGSGWRWRGPSFRDAPLVILDEPTAALDARAEHELFARIAELVAERGEGLGAPGRGERVEPDEQSAVTEADVAGDGQCFADQGAGLVAGAGVVAVQGAGQGGLGVIGGHTDGVGDLLGLGVQPDHVRGEVAERDPGRDGRRGLVCFLQVAPGGLDRGGQRVDHLVADVGGLAGGGAAQLEQRGVPGRLGSLVDPEPPARDGGADQPGKTAAGNCLAGQRRPQAGPLSNVVRVREVPACDNPVERSAELGTIPSVEQAKATEVGQYRHRQSLGPGIRFDLVRRRLALDAHARLLGFNIEAQHRVGSRAGSECIVGDGNSRYALRKLRFRKVVIPRCLARHGGHGHHKTMEDDVAGQARGPRDRRRPIPEPQRGDQ
jgi:hypothetical protein